MVYSTARGVESERDRLTLAESDVALVNAHSFLIEKARHTVFDNFIVIPPS